VCAQSTCVLQLRLVIPPPTSYSGRVFPPPESMLPVSMLPVLKTFTYQPAHRSRGECRQKPPSFPSCCGRGCRETGPAADILLAAAKEWTDDDSIVGRRGRKTTSK
jgi:hypothetical protein